MAKALLIESILRKKGVSAEEIAKALNEFVNTEGKNLDEIVRTVQNTLAKGENISQVRIFSRLLNVLHNYHHSLRRMT